MLQYYCFFMLLFQHPNWKKCEIDDFEDWLCYARNKFSGSKLRFYFGISSWLRHYRLNFHSTRSGLFLPFRAKTWPSLRSASSFGDNALPRRYSSYRLVQTPRTYKFREFKGVICWWGGPPGENLFFLNFSGVLMSFPKKRGTQIFTSSENIKTFRKSWSRIAI